MPKRGRGTRHLFAVLLVIVAAAIGDPEATMAQQVGVGPVVDPASTSPTSEGKRYLPIREAVNAVLPRSTISFYSIHGQRVTFGNMPKSLFEARLASHFPIYASDREGTVPESVCLCALVFTMNADLRMSDTESMPVRTPSLRPELRFLFQFPFWDWAPNTFLHLRAYHYSNGEEGPTVVNGEFNYMNGSFSHDIVLGVTLSHGYLTSARAGQLGYAFGSLEMDWFPLSDPFTRDDYGDLKFTGSISAAIRDPSIPGLPQEGTLTAQVAFWPNGAHREGLRHFDAELTYAIRPFIHTRLGSFGMFVGGYWGRDYYNLNYHRGNLWTLRWGIMAVNPDFEIDQ